MCGSSLFSVFLCSYFSKYWNFIAFRKLFRNSVFTEKTDFRISDFRNSALSLWDFFSFFYVFAEFKTHNPNPFGLWSKTWRARIMGTSEYLNSKPKYLRKRIYRCPVGGVKWMNNCRTAEKKLWDSVRKISRNIWLEVRVRDDIRVRPSIFYMLFLHMPRGSLLLKIFELF